MRKATFLFFSFCICAYVNAQEQNTEKRQVKTTTAEEVISTSDNPSGVTYINVNTTVTKEKTYSVNRNGEQVEHNKEYYQKKLVSIDETISAVHIKKEYIQNTPEQHTLALSNGWYEKMEAVVEKLNNDRVEVLKRIEELD